MNKPLSLFLLFIASIFYSLGQMPVCTGGNPSCILCYGDFENFSSSTDLDQGLRNGVFAGNYGSSDLILEHNTFGNSSNFVRLGSCPVNGVNEAPVMILPLKSPLHPCLSGTFSFDYSGVFDASGYPPSYLRVYFFENDVASLCGGQNFLSCSGGGAWDQIDIELDPISTPNWENIVVNYQNNTTSTYNYMVVEYSFTNNQMEVCSGVSLDDLSFCTDEYSEEITIHGPQTNFCKKEDVVPTKIQVNNNFCMIDPSNIWWTVVSGDFNSVQSIGVNHDFIWVAPNQTTTYQVTVVGPSGTTHTETFTIHVGAVAGTIVPSTINPPQNSTFWLTLTNYNGTSVLWQKSHKLPSGWTPFTTFSSGPLPSSEVVYDTYFHHQTRYRAIVRCGGQTAITRFVTIGSSKGKSSTNEMDVSEDGVSILVYPNPVKDVLYIETSIDENAAYEVIGLNGKIVQHGNQSKFTELDVSDLDKGAYILKISYDNELFIERFLKE